MYTITTRTTTKTSFIHKFPLAMVQADFSEAGGSIRLTPDYNKLHCVEVQLPSPQEHLCPSQMGKFICNELALLFGSKSDLPFLIEKSCSDSEMYRCSHLTHQLLRHFTSQLHSQVVEAKSSAGEKSKSVEEICSVSFELIKEEKDGDSAVIVKLVPCSSGDFKVLAGKGGRDFTKVYQGEAKATLRTIETILERLSDGDSVEPSVENLWDIEGLQELLGEKVQLGSISEYDAYSNATEYQQAMDVLKLIMAKF